MTQDIRHFAEELGMIVGALKINTDLERVGDLAVNICEAAERYVNHPPVKPLIDLPRMSDMAQRMLHGSLEAFVSRVRPTRWPSAAAAPLVTQDAHGERGRLCLIWAKTDPASWCSARRQSVLLEQPRIDRVLASLDDHDAFGVPVSGVEQEIECLGNDRRRNAE
jgi:hypothetical protein